MDKYCMIVVFYIICGFVDLGITECQQNWIEAVGNCFYISQLSDKRKYAQAKEQCSSFGGDIASFTEDQFTVIKENLGTSDYWIGLTCSTSCDQVSNWHWEDGLAAGNWVESNWVFGEPDLGEIYSRVTDTGKWGGLYSSFDIGYICKKEITNAVASTVTTTAATTSSTKVTSTSRTTTISTPTTTTVLTSSKTSETTSSAFDGNNIQSSRLTHFPNKDYTPTKENKIWTQTVVLESDINFGDSAAGNGKEQNPVSDGHLGLWIGMGCACVIGIVALILGIVFYLKAKKHRIHRRNHNVTYTPERFTPDLIPRSPPPAYPPPQSPPPAYLPPEYMYNAVAPLDPRRDCIYRNGPQVNIIKVHPELNEYDKL